MPQSGLTPELSRAARRRRLERIVRSRLWSDALVLNEVPSVLGASPPIIAPHLSDDESATAKCLMNCLRDLLRRAFRYEVERVWQIVAPGIDQGHAIEGLFDLLSCPQRVTV